MTWFEQSAQNGAIAGECRKPGPAPPLPDGAEAFLRRCVSIDLEVDPSQARIFKLAAVRHAPGDKLLHMGAVDEEILARLAAYCASADFIIGHNFARFDLPHLVGYSPRLIDLAERAIDTLWLNPLAFPRNPYHHLVKHHHDGRLQAGQAGAPEKDARLVFGVLENQLRAFPALGEQALCAYHFLTSQAPEHAGFDAVFALLRHAARPTARDAWKAVRALLEGRACTRAIERLRKRFRAPGQGWPLAYALSWINVAGGQSVMAPWVRVQFPDAARIVRELRGVACGRADCQWCRTKADPQAALRAWFGFSGFRPEPRDEAGRSLQERIVAEAMAERDVLGILPTGTGKSICYQLPALTKFERTGALSVVISPLVALMADQVRGLKQHGIDSCVTVNGLLSLPERHAALEAVRLGEASMLLISPEQLRSFSVRSVLTQREIGTWILDEAHCLSKWGHDFRPDYRYIARFIKEFPGNGPPAPILCLTATAKPEVIAEISAHFKTRLGRELVLLNGGAARNNLSFEVRQTNGERKMADILEVLESTLPREGKSGAIVYCATRAGTEKVAEFLRQQGHAVEHFHAGIPPEQKKEVQQRFQEGTLRVIAATNAFGMGIDKPDIRLVVHADIPGSLENYLQEAGRAGRDRAPARCVLLFCEDDVERQFALSARSRLAQHEINAIHKALRRLDERQKKNGSVIATPGEIVREEKDQEFERDQATDDTRVKTAVAWLEEARLVSREENRVQVFASSLKVRSLAEAAARMDKAPITRARRAQLIRVVKPLLMAPRDKGIGTDELAGQAGLSPLDLQRALRDLETLGIATNDTAISAYVSAGVVGASKARLGATAERERALLALLRTLAPDACDEGRALGLHLRQCCMRLREEAGIKLRPDQVMSLMRGLARDGRDDGARQGNLHVRKRGRESCMVRVQKPWREIAAYADLRTQAAERILEHFLAGLEKGRRGKDIQVVSTMGALHAAIAGDAFLRQSGIDPTRLAERALLWMHEQDILMLGRGLTIFRQAITVHLEKEKRQFTSNDFKPLEDHYRAQTLQTHIMAAYAQLGLASMDSAQRLVRDYFRQSEPDFLAKWLPEKPAELQRQTLPASWHTIVEQLGNPVQEKIVADDRQQTNVLVLAGPGSGKTRVLVHRIAYLVRVRREDPRGILALVYNRHAADEIRARLKQLIGADAARVTISTCHAFAMRLLGMSFAGRAEAAGAIEFDKILRQAVDLIEGKGLEKPEMEARRAELLHGYRWLLVDEYQDVGPEEYALIAAVAGRSLEDPDLRISLFAVGDDDQNIYAFSGASVEFIRRFQDDYKAQPFYLTENFRSTANIIEAANRVIAPAQNRMKAEHPITVDRARRDAPKGGALAQLDPVAQGRVQILHTSDNAADQAIAAVGELERLSALVPGWSWGRAAVIAREWRYLHPVRSRCEHLAIPAHMANERGPGLWRMREMQTLLRHLRVDPLRLVAPDRMLAFIRTQPANIWWQQIGDGLARMQAALGGQPAPAAEIVEWLAEWSNAERTAPTGLQLLSAHRAKGLEFDHVILLDGAWQKRAPEEDPDAARRLYYVAMTRARQSLTLVQTAADHPFLAKDDCRALLGRSPNIDPGERATCTRLYGPPDPAMVDLSHAGRLRADHPALAAISKASTGDPLTIEKQGNRWWIRNSDGIPIGRMAKKFEPPQGYRIDEARIGGVMVWRKLDNDEQYHASIRRDEWETVLPDITYAPR